MYKKIIHVHCYFILLFTLIISWLSHFGGSKIMQVLVLLYICCQFQSGEEVPSGRPELRITYSNIRTLISPTTISYHFY